MKLASNWRTFSVLAGALCALVGVEFGAVDAASASCGDYVVIEGSHAHGSSHPHNAGFGHESAGAIHQAFQKSPPAPAPCKGGQCSRRSTPPLSPVRGIVIEHEQWATLHVTISETKPPTHLLLLAAPPHQVDRTRKIFSPPD